MEIPEQNKTNLYRALLGLLIILSLYFAAKFLSEVKSYSILGNVNVSTIVISGHGEVQAVPDIASVYFTISKESKTVKEAQEGVAVVEKKALDFLKTRNVNEKDIKTTDSSFYPKYDYVRKMCPQIGIEGGMYDCGNGKQILTGYISSESITVKVRNTDDVGAIMQGLGTVGVSNLSGPNFSIDDEDALKIEARKLAIDEAKSKAKILAKERTVFLHKFIRELKKELAF